MTPSREFTVSDYFERLWVGDIAEEVRVLGGITVIGDDDSWLLDIYWGPVSDQAWVKVPVTHWYSSDPSRYIPRASMGLLDSRYFQSSWIRIPGSNQIRTPLLPQAR